jgi:hypothetical protein
VTAQEARLLQAAPETRLVSWPRRERLPPETQQRRAEGRAQQSLSDQAERRAAAAKWRNDGPALRVATESDALAASAPAVSPWKNKIPAGAMFYDETAALTESPQPGALISIKV